ncbi:hypothetical protein HYC85_005725 [Camellia sinensis]|uniref:Transmembrane protein 230 n=1 Tax=Camellia sinensis TaxID=4442 RepID=A0A7J7I0B0_CAMSI|nr:hypothetical protein HYC85_005725 [Camellia sinensis]
MLATSSCHSLNLQASLKTKLSPRIRLRPRRNEETDKAKFSTLNEQVFDLTQDEGDGVSKTLSLRRPHLTRLLPRRALTRLYKRPTLSSRPRRLPGSLPSCLLGVRHSPLPMPSSFYSFLTFETMLKVQRHLFAKNKKLQITDMASRRQVRYNRLATDDDNDYNTGGHDPRFDYTPKSFDKVPWKSIALALFLLALGCMLLFLSYFVFTGHMGGERSQAYGLLGLGILTFLQACRLDWQSDPNRDACRPVD